MYKQITIKNFRGIRELTVPLTQFNIFTGKNDVGKSSVLEILYILASKYALGVEIPAKSRNAKSSLEILEVVKDMFSFKSNELVICAEATIGELSTEKVTIQPIYSSGRSRVFSGKQLDVDTIKEFSNLHRADGVIANYEFVEGSGIIRDQFSTSYVLKIDQILHDSDRAVNYSSTPCVFVSESLNDPEQIASWYSELVLNGDERKIVDSFKIIDERISDVFSLQPPPYKKLTLFADVGLQKKVTFASLGDGVNWLSEIILSLNKASNGVLLIDEIETGLHYSIMKDVWKVIHKIARECNTQIFATTHSWECLKAANEAFTELESKELSIHRLVRKDGETLCATYDSEAIQGSFEMNWEIR